MRDGEYEFDDRFGVAPTVDVPKIENNWFPAFSLNKTLGLTQGCRRVLVGSGSRNLKVSISTFDLE